MKSRQIWLLSSFLLLTVAGWGQTASNAAGTSTSQAQPAQPAPTIAAAVDREISAIEKQVLEKVMEK